MRLTPEVLRAAYRFITSAHPFTDWVCPPADAMRFQVYAHRSHLGDYAEGTIWISTHCVRHMDTLVRVMAHEALHAVQHLDGTDNRYSHNADFHRRAAEICEAFGWDVGLFV